MSATPSAPISSIVVVLTKDQWLVIQDALEHPSHTSAEVIGAILDRGREGHDGAVVLAR